MLTAADTPSFAQRFARLGTLRSLLLLAAMLVIAAAPLADGIVHLHDWRLLPSVVAPTIMMMLVFAIPLDITMARIFMVDAAPAERARLRFAIRLEVGILILMLLAWMPFIYSVVDFTPLGSIPP